MTPHQFLKTKLLLFQNKDCHFNKNVLTELNFEIGAGQAEGRGSATRIGGQAEIRGKEFWPP